MKKLHLLFFVPAILFCHSTLASQPPQYQDMTSDIAVSLVSTALSICHSENKTGVVAVVDKGGDNYSDTPEMLGGGGARFACGVIE